MYHGWGRKRTYFEGWYYKMVSADEQNALAIIPGIAIDEFGNKEAFIQVFDGKNSQAEFHIFSANNFVPDKSRFQLQIESNQFSIDHAHLDLPGLKGQLSFQNTSSWPRKWYSPGIMGPGAFVPYMQCYHGVLSMDHSIQGEINLNGNIMDFTGGKGYLEKDWGQSFPQAYFWMQCNHFDNPELSVKASVARVPWMGQSFTGFIAGVQIGDELIQFTTYNFTKLVHSFANDDQIELILRNRKYELQLIAEIHETTALNSPIKGLMDGKVNESMTSALKLTLIERHSKK